VVTDGAAGTVTGLLDVLVREGVGKGVVDEELVGVLELVDVVEVVLVVVGRDVEELEVVLDVTV
jgi:hypothetical protein